MAQYTELLGNIYHGSFTDELNTELSELVNQCNLTGKGGEITVVLKLKPYSDGTMEINGDVKTKLPKHERGKAVLFSTPDGNLQTQDPRQKNLEFKEVESKPLKMAVAK